MADVRTFPSGTRCVYCGRKPRRWAHGTGAVPMCANVAACTAERNKSIRPTLSYKGPGAS